MKNVGRRRHRDPGTRNKAHQETTCARLATSSTPISWEFETRDMARAYSRADEKRLKKADKAEWRLHAHLLVIGAVSDKIDNLRPASAGDRAVKVQPLRDPARQLSYLLKFVTYFRPHRQTGPSRSRAVPLPTARFLELAAWRVDAARAISCYFTARAWAQATGSGLCRTPNPAHGPTRPRTKKA